VVATSALGPHEGSRGGLFELEVETTADASRLEEIQDKLQRFLNGKDDSIMVERLPTNDSGSVGSLDGGVTSTMDRHRSDPNTASTSRGRSREQSHGSASHGSASRVRTGFGHDLGRKGAYSHSSHRATYDRSDSRGGPGAKTSRGKRGDRSASAMDRWLAEEEERRAEIRRRVETGEGSILKRGKKKMEAMKAAAASAARSRDTSRTRYTS